jgi:serine/threonine protein kinase
MIGKKIEKYTIKSELGQGGMATVFLAHDNKFDTEVAIKLLRKEFVLNENIRKRFIAEARSMFKMSHPNIIKVTDLIEEGDTVAFVMEYVEGETLKEYIDRKGKLKDEEIKHLFSQMLEAMAYVHKQNLVHRDIKPSNFMIDQARLVKLMDFGIAKTLDTASAEYTITATNQSMGTPMYMSPEQITETKSVSSQSDIYSLGVVLWQMVTGQKPYNIKTLSNYQLQTKIVNEKLPSTSSIFNIIIEKSTVKNLDHRIKNCGEFKNNFENLQKVDKESTKAYTSQNFEKTIIETAADETIVEKPKQPQILSPSEIKTPYNPPVEKSNSFIIFIILGIILITGIGIAISNKIDPYDADAIALEDDSAKFKYLKETAHEDNRRTLEIDPNNYDANLNLAVLYFNEAVETKRALDSMDMKTYNTPGGKEIELKVCQQFAASKLYFDKCKTLKAALGADDDLVLENLKNLERILKQCYK